VTVDDTMALSACSASAVSGAAAHIGSRPGVNVLVRGDAGQPAELVALVDGGELRVDVADRAPLAELPAVHAAASSGGLPGKVVVVAGAA